VSSQDLGRVLIVAGVVLTMTGVVLYLGKGIPWLGRLPGDIRVERPGFSLHVPLMTSLVLSVILSAILYFVSRHR
jgi:hypothetical protein